MKRARPGRPRCRRFACLLAAAAGFGGDGRKFFEDVVSGDHRAERGVLTVEEFGVAVTDKELRAGRVWAGRAGHREDAAHVGLGVELRFDLPAGTAGTGHTFFADFGVGATALDHEALDDAMKCSAVIKTGTGEFLEVFNRLGGDVGPERDGQFAVGGLDDGVFLGGSGGAHLNNGGANRERF